MTSTHASARKSILDSASALFLDRGFDAVSMDEVRRAAGVSNGSLYHHFPTKAHLARELYLAAMADYQSYMKGAIAASPPAEAGVRALVTRHIAWVLRSPRQALVLDRLRPFTAIDGRQPDWGAENADAFSHLVSWIAVQVARGDMAKLPFDVWFALVLGPTLRLTPGWASEGRFAIPPRVRAALADAAWAAVKASPSDHPRPRPAQ